MRIHEDGVWRYFNCPDPIWSEKCRFCREKVAETKRPVEECLNCWKVEIWSLGPAMRAFRRRHEGYLRFSEEQDFLIDGLAAKGIRAVAKASRAPILVVRTGIPRDAYPDDITDYLLMLYAKTIGDRDRLVESALDVLDVSNMDGAAGSCAPLTGSEPALLLPPVGEERDRHRVVDDGHASCAVEITSFDPSEAVGGFTLPIRRGCWRFDNILGPWQAWADPKTDFVPDAGSSD